MAKLELYWYLDGPRYYLDQRPVHAGDILHARNGRGVWTHVRFEYDWNRRANTIEPFLIVSAHEGRLELLDADVECCWPD